MRTYEGLRSDLNEPERVAKSMGKVFAQMALLEDGRTSAVIAAAALNVPRETIADLISLDPADVDAVVSTFTDRLATQLRGERRAAS